MLLKRFMLVIGFLLHVTTAGADSGPRVVASFSILGDLVAQVGGDRITLQVLVGPDQDAHVYQPTPNDVQQLATAQLVVVNGLGFEGWIDRLVEASGYQGPIIIAAQDVVGLSNEEGGLDPHVWQNPQHVRRYIQNITNGLVAIDPAGQTQYQQNASIFLEKLAQLDQEIRVATAALQKDQRTVVTSHDAFAYFGKAYNLKFVAPQGMNTDSEASAHDVAALIRQIQRDKIPAVFVENISDPRLLQQIARETGAHIGGTLYSDALSAADGDASNYLAMMRHNLKVLVSALNASTLEDL